jgi:hypothetical protein
MGTKLIAAATMACALALPAAARANTLTVDPADANNACARGGDEVCKTIAQAAATVQTGDTVDIKAGSYPETVTFPSGADNLTITGAGPTATTVTGAAGNTGAALTLAGSATSIKGLQVDVTSDGGSAISVTGGGATTIDTTFLFRKQGAATSAAVVSASGGGLVTLKNSTLLQSAGLATDPAVLSTGAGGLAAVDDVVVSAKGPALRFEDSDANAITRTAAVTTAAGVNVVEVISAANSASTKKLALDSSSLAGTGGTAAGLFAQSQGTGGIPASTAGDITIDARYITTAGQGKGIVLDASAAEASPTLLTLGPPTPVGSISATVANSIVHGPSRAVQFAGRTTGIPPVAVGSAANTATLAFTNTDAPPKDASAAGTDQTLGTITGDGSATPDSQLFINLAAKNLHLRQDAPVIDKAPPLAGGSATDVDGQPRALDGIDDDSVAQPDLGADEALNLPPTARLIAGPRFIRQNQVTGFDASASTDPEASIGGGVVSYQWSYGDGTPGETTTGPVTFHRYKQIGTFQATVRVVDKAGVVSAPATPVTISVVDGIPPAISITRPTSGLKVNRAKKLLGFGGRVSDNTGVRSVEISVRLVKRAATKNKKGKLVKPKALPTGTCEYFTGKKAIVKRTCKTPLFFGARVLDFTWSFSVPKAVKLPLGTYEVRVRAADSLGNATTTFTKAAKTLIGFSVTG